ncbi:MAG: hypothetical protein HGA23_01195 [Bacteroidales bacterium]|nr:hypothetical protein [Bacteroidales bacterium]
MKKAILNLIITGLFVVVPVIMATASAPPPPPPPPGGGGSDPNPIGGGPAPVGSGLVMLISMGAAYGAKKVFDARKKLEE